MSKRKTLPWIFIFTTIQFTEFHFYLADHHCVHAAHEKSVVVAIRSEAKIVRWFFNHSSIFISPAHSIDFRIPKELVTILKWFDVWWSKVKIKKVKSHIADSVEIFEDPEWGAGAAAQGVAGIMALGRNIKTILVILCSDKSSISISVRHYFSHVKSNILSEL